MGLEAGDYDFVYKPSSSLCDNLSGDSKYKVWYTTNEQVVILPMNTDREPFNVKEVRQAVALAINYDAILQIACGGHGVVTDSPWSPSNSAYSPVDESKPNYLGRYDPEEAKKLLTEAGYADGFEFTLTYRTNDSVWVKSAEIIANNLQAVNIKVELEQIDSASFYPRSESGDFDSLLWSQQNPNPRRMIQIIDERYTQCNTEGGWLQPGYQELFDKAIYELDDELRNEYFAEVTDLVRDEVPLIPLVQVYTAVITRSEVVNYTIDSYGNPKIETMYEADYLA